MTISLNPTLVEATKFLQNKGFSPEVTAGIVGNLYHESAGNPEALGDNGTSVGLAQWHNERASGLMDYADRIGMSAKDPGVQMNWLVHEIKSDPKLYDALGKAKTASSAADIFQRHFERPAQIDHERSATAEKVLTAIKSGAPDTLERMGRGAYESFTGGAQLVGRGLKALGLENQQTVNDYETKLSNETEAYNLRKQLAGDNGRIAETVGNVIGSIPYALVPGGGEAVGAVRSAVGLAPKAAGILGKVAAGVAENVPGGALAGAVGTGPRLQEGQSDADYWNSVAGDAATGAAAGGVLGGAVEGARGAVFALRNGKAAQQARVLANRGVETTSGQSLGIGKAEDKYVGSLPIIGEQHASRTTDALTSFNRAVYDDVLRPINQSVPTHVDVGKDSVKAVGDLIGDEFDKWTPKVFINRTPALDQAFIDARNAADVLPTTLQKRIDKLEEYVSKRSAARADSYASEQIRNFANSSSGEDRDLGQIMLALRREIRNSFVSNDPDAVKALANARQAWANYSVLEKSVNRNGMVIPNKYDALVNKRDGTIKQGLGELSQAGADVLGNSKYPDSGTAGRTLPWLIAGGAVRPDAIPYMTALSVPQTGVGARVIRNLTKKAPQYSGPVNAAPNVPAVVANAATSKKPKALNSEQKDVARRMFPHLSANDAYRAYSEAMNR